MMDKLIDSFLACTFLYKKLGLNGSKGNGSSDDGDDEMEPTKKKAKIHQRPQRNATFARYRVSSSSEESNISK